MYGICTDYRISRAIGKNPQNYRISRRTPDHATLRHLVSTENVNALTARRFALWSDIIAPYIGMNDEGNAAFEIVYRKGSENDSDALSRRPDLHHEITTYDNLVQEKDLEIANDFSLACITYRLIRTSYTR